MQFGDPLQAPLPATGSDKAVGIDIHLQAHPRRQLHSGKSALDNSLYVHSLLDLNQRPSAVLAAKKA